MNVAVLEIKNLSKNFDGITALSDFSMSILQKGIYGLIGPNGAGKTTLFNVLTGFIQADDGKAKFKEFDLLRLSPQAITGSGIARTFQDLRIITKLTAMENVLLSYQDQKGEKLGNLFFRASHVREQERSLMGSARQLLEDAGLVDKADELAGNLSYGQQKLLTLCCCLATNAELILLDEPVAGIAPEMAEKILSALKELPQKGKTVLLIEHNMDAVSEICEQVIFMDEGKNIAQGTPDEIKSNPQVIEAYLE